ncbi:hypothetical protein [Actinoplanes regularis]|uniref:hypothetical protein n=1 Tax=Actinoplanes regularis TaxID=52697 RepID=UPI0024A3C3E5|nr:hypothetical protein [Actinoplanes regularis]GLW32307.1 hypothetical protein Areg01_52460 [Actinoplanes regularis]
MPGKNPSEAFYNFHRPLQQNITCLSRDDVLVASPGGRHELGKTHGLSLAGGPMLLTGEGLQLDVGLQYELIKTGETGKNAYRVTTRAYAYTLLDEDNKPLYGWHWHPFGKSSFFAPHTHPFGMGAHSILPHRAHMPSGRVSLESVVRCCIDQLGADAARDDWDKLLTLNEGKFELHRSWSDATGAPRPSDA